MRSSRGPVNARSAIEIFVREQTLGKRRKRDGTHAVFGQYAGQATLDPAVEQRVRRLMNDQWCAQPVRNRCGLASVLGGI